MKCWITFLIVVLFPVADVGTLFLLSSWIGVIWTLGLVAFSTAMGLLACRRWMNLLTAHHDEMKARYNIAIPPDVVVIQASEAFLSLFAMACFLFPGLLSDVVGFFLALPKTQKGFIDKVMTGTQEQAKARGQTVEQFLHDRAEKRP